MESVQNSCCRDQNREAFSLSDWRGLAGKIIGKRIKKWPYKRKEMRPNHLKACKK